MITLVISDLHSNDAALGAVFAHVRRKSIDRIICLGDFVGYGAQPNQVLDKIRTFKARKLYIRGNHDRVAGGFEDGEGFNFAARSAALWTRDHLSGINRRFLQELPVGPLSAGEGVLICHGSPFDEDEYLFSEYDARRIFDVYSENVILFGHTHLPSFFTLEPDGSVHGLLVREATRFQLASGKRYLINPGSVGQPRDRNPQSAFLLFDDQKKSVQFQRVAYDISATRESILRAGLPRILADRLLVGT
ncbi:MAG TPA: metallophosphoesterase family protein [Thermoanaerobaculia bacterium]|nr:metallophosphoesterase family protein [Thermoanaerobaculia bacterium]